MAFRRLLLHSDVINFGNNPGQINARIVREGRGQTHDQDKERILSYLQDQLVREVRRRRRNWTRDWILNHVRARLVVNRPDGGSIGRDRFRPVGELDTGIMDHLVEAIHQSNEELTIFDLVWGIELDPTSFTLGGGDSVKWKPGFNQQTISNNDYNCAIGSLLYGSSMCGIDTVSGHKHWHSTTSLRYATLCKNYLEKLKWNIPAYETGVPMNQLGKWVTLPEFKKMKVVCFYDGLSQTTDLIWEGEEYEYDRTNPKNNIVYLVYCIGNGGRGHYVHLSHPDKYFQTQSGCSDDKRKLCHACSSPYNRLRGHDCILGPSLDPNGTGRIDYQNDQWITLSDNDEGTNEEQAYKGTTPAGRTVYGWDATTPANSPTDTKPITNKRRKVEPDPKPRIRNTTKCRDCNSVLYRPHLCYHRWCRQCRVFFPIDGMNNYLTHRCIINSPPTKADAEPFVGENIRNENFEGWFTKPTKGIDPIQYVQDDFEEEIVDLIDDPLGPDENTKAWNVWAYDLEAALEYSIEKRNFDHINKDGEIEVLTKHVATHRPNLVCVQNVFTGEKQRHDSIDGFVNFLFSKGNHVCIAHNGSGYDTRHVFDSCTKHTRAPKRLIKRGNQIILAQYGNVMFLDSLLHLKGSLANLAKDFGLNTGKGHFPHLYNVAGHWTHAGDMPNEECYIDRRFIRKKEDEDELKTWYEEEQMKQKQWNVIHNGKKPYWIFAKELVKYCEQDVNILAQILRIYHDEIIEVAGISPLRKATSASMAHAIMMKKYLAVYNRDNVFPKIGHCEPTEFDSDTRKKNKNLCTLPNANITWTVLLPPEYSFARQALRGGRTDIRCRYLKLDQEALDRGESIRYIDVVSMYPTMQIKYEYPVGTPLIHIYGGEIPKKWNSCLRKLRIQVHTEVGYDRIVRGIQPTMEFLKTFFGFIECDITPSCLFHPILVYYDDVKKKCLASLDPIKKKVFTSVEFQLALDHGYTVDHVYRIDEYQKAPSMWGQMVKDLAVFKISNSGVPSGVSEKDYRQAYKSRFEMTLCDEITFSPAKKATYKVPLNSSWGKCAESICHMESTILDAFDIKGIKKFFGKVNNGTFATTTTTYLSEKLALYDYQINRDVIDPDLSKGYLPAAVFVPAYGRITLWKELHKLGTRVLMHDTDSIVYHSIPGEYDTVLGHLLGDWELDRIHKTGTPFEFFGLRPKSYGVRTSDGGQILKLKGISLSLDAQHHATFENCRDLILNTNKQTLLVNQVGFKWNPTSGMITQDYIKRITPGSFSDMKGCPDPDTHVIYPFGFTVTRQKLDEHDEVVWGTFERWLATDSGWKIIEEFKTDVDIPDLSPAYSPESPVSS